MTFDHFMVGMLQTNCYVLGDPESGQAVVIDPGGDAARIIRRIQELNLNLAAILNTHAHYDHVMDAWTLKAKLGGEIFMHEKDQPLLQDSMVGMSALFGSGASAPKVKVDRTLREGDRLQFGAIEFEVLETPGHSPGHVSFYMPSAGVIFVGDTLFAGSIGRTDFPGGSFEMLIRSVKEKIFTLHGNTVVYPGHGPKTTVEYEKRTNPFFGR